MEAKEEVKTEGGNIVEQPINSTILDSGINQVSKMVKLKEAAGGWMNIFTSIIMLMFLGFALYVTFNWKAIITQAFEIGSKAVQEQEQIDHDRREKIRREISPRLNDILRKLVYESGANRAWFLESHNGTVGNNGLPFAYTNMTYEVTKNNKISDITDEYAQVLLTKYDFAYYLHENTLWNGTIEELMEIDGSWAKRIAASGAVYAAFICIRDSNEREIGYVGFSFSNMEDVVYTKTQYDRILINYSQSISSEMNKISSIEYTYNQRKR